MMVRREKLKKQQVLATERLVDAVRQATTAAAGASKRDISHLQRYFPLVTEYQGVASVEDDNEVVVIEDKRTSVKPEKDVLDGPRRRLDSDGISESGHGSPSASSRRRKGQKAAKRKAGVGSGSEVEEKAPETPVRQKTIRKQLSPKRRVIRCTPDKSGTLETGSPAQKSPAVPEKIDVPDPSADRDKPIVRSPGKPVQGSHPPSKLEPRRPPDTKHSPINGLKRSLMDRSDSVTGRTTRLRLASPTRNGTGKERSSTRVRSHKKKHGLPLKRRPDSSAQNDKDRRLNSVVRHKSLVGKSPEPAVNPGSGSEDSGPSRRYTATARSNWNIFDKLSVGKNA